VCVVDTSVARALFTLLFYVIYMETPVSTVTCWKEVIMLLALSICPSSRINLIERGNLIGAPGRIEYMFQYSLPSNDMGVQLGIVDPLSLTWTLEILDTIELSASENPNHHMLDPPLIWAKTAAGDAIDGSASTAVVVVGATVVVVIGATVVVVIGATVVVVGATVVVVVVGALVFCGLLVVVGA